MVDILIYAVIAAVLAWRLYSVLGTRHEGEANRQRPNPFVPPQDHPPSSDDKNLLALPLPPKSAPVPREAMPQIMGPAPQSLAGILYALQQAEPDFDEKAFVKGARLAFEMIVHAFAAGETESLRPLVSPVLFEAFKSAIEARKAANQRLEIKLLNLIEAHITEARMDARHASLTMEFVSDQARATYENDALKEDGKTERLTDFWTFRREMGAANPNWMLVETRSV